MKIYLASGNLHKKQEFQGIFNEHEIVIPADEGINFDPEETGDSFIANSLIKAEALWEITKQPVLADDSGICVDILGGLPGIYSARYSGRNSRQGASDGKKLQQEERNRLLLEDVAQEISIRNQDNRFCHYVCAMVLYLSKDRFYAVQETMEGELIKDFSLAKGQGGFGYDPIVILPEYKKTVAELSAEEKNIISHRGKAGKKLQEFLEKKEASK